MTIDKEIYCGEAYCIEDRPFILKVSVDDEGNKVFIAQDIFTDEKEFLTDEDVKKIQPLMFETKEHVDSALSSDVVWTTGLYYNGKPFSGNHRVFKSFASAKKYHDELESVWEKDGWEVITNINVLRD